MDRPARELGVGEKLPFEIRQDVLDSISHLHEHDRDRLMFESPKLAERYMKGDLHIALKYRIRGNGEEYEAVFSRLPSADAEPDVA